MILASPCAEVKTEMASEAIPEGSVIDVMTPSLCPV
jgi:hypothetical protein